MLPVSMRWPRHPGLRIPIGIGFVAGAFVLANLALPDLAAVAVGILAVIAAYVAYVRLVEKRALYEFAAERAALELALGLAVGAALFCSTMLVLWLAGYATIRVDGGLAALPRPLLFALGAATFEELLFRGVLLRLLAAWVGRWWALAASAAIFGAMHAFNPNATILGVVSVAVEAGILLGAAFLATRRLWLPIGLHIAWNFTESGIFGAALSGNDTHGYLRSDFAGPELWTGGTFGPEASLVAVLVCLVAAAPFLRRISTQ